MPIGQLTRSRRPLISIGRIIASAVATLGLLAIPAAAAAFGEDEYGTVTILDRDAGAEVIVDGEARVCGFAFVFDLDTEDGTIPLVGWRVRTWAADPLAGEIVLAGADGPTDQDGVLRQPRDGWFELPEGRYTVLWDDEDPPDRSAGLRTFTVECEEATPTPTEAPTATPEASVGGETATPEASVGGETDTASITLPPTDTVGGGAEQPSQSGWIAIAVLAGLVATVFVLTPRASVRRR